MSRTTIVLSIGVIYVCCLAIGFGETAVGPNPTGINGPSGPKKVRPLTPALTRLYRLLRGGDDEEIFADDDSYLQKRQQYDDYGHMRFGKRNQPGKDFDDYGHLRFGK